MGDFAAEDTFRVTQLTAASFEAYKLGKTLPPHRLGGVRKLDAR